MAFPASVQTLSDDVPQNSDTHKQAKSDDDDNNNDYDLDSNDYDLDSNDNGTPLRFLPLQHVYSTSAPCSSAVVSKKVRARRSVMEADDCAPNQQPLLVAVGKVFGRRGKEDSSKVSFFDMFVERFEPPLKKRALLEVKSEQVDADFDAPSVVPNRKRRVRAGEAVKLGVHSNGFCSPNGPKLRESCNGRNASGKNSSTSKRRKVNSAPVAHRKVKDLRVRKWIRLSCEGATPIKLVGLRCQVYWPMDDDWYQGSIIAYDAESKRHNLKYEDGEEEDLVLSREKVCIP